MARYWKPTLLIDANSTNPKKGVTLKTYSIVVGRVCGAKKIDARHLAH